MKRTWQNGLRFRGIFLSMSDQSGGHRIRLSRLNDQLTCKLCGGYFIDATTIIECLHSFCRSCIVKYLESNKYCPICEVQVHKSRPLLNIRPDHTLQDIVYKLVPGCYQNEMRCRREFYKKNPEAWKEAGSPEARGEPIESHIYSPDESLSLSLEYYSPCSKENGGRNSNLVKESSGKPVPRRYLRCPAAVTVFHLQKLIRAKYGLTDAHRVDVMYKEEALCASYTLMDVMYIYHWRRKVPLHLSYRIFSSSPKRARLSEDNPNYRKSLYQTGIEAGLDLISDKPLKREWKEVQLKISESGVMSITDISSSQSTRSPRPEEHTEISENSKKTTAATNLEENRISEVHLESSKIKNEERTGEILDNNNITTKTILQKSLESNITEKEQKPEEEENADGRRLKNNNIIEGKVEAKKSKLLNTGSKIDALSAKLQFQPRALAAPAQTANKKKEKERKRLLEKDKIKQNNEKEEKLTKEGKEPTDKEKEAKKEVDVVMEDKEQEAEEKSENERKLEKVEIKETLRPEPKVENANHSVSPKCTSLESEAIDKSPSTNFKVATTNQETSSQFSIQDQANRMILKSTTTKSTETTTETIPKFTPGTSGINIETLIPSSASQPVPCPTMKQQSTSTNIQGNYMTQTSSFAETAKMVVKPVLESNAVYPNPAVPPCPDAIPISLMKPPIRKSELITKGSNLNEICAKIGASASKINDMSSKIGENSKDKNRSDTPRSKPDIPELLKIGRGSGSSSTLCAETTKPSNIPKISVYAATGTITTENKTVYPNLKTNNTQLPGNLAQRSSQATKKQGQPVGYKTLRDPPRSWNPTLSRNNYVAVKNQSKETIQNQSQSSDRSKPIQSKPAKIFKMRNVPRYLGNPASGVKPMYGIGTESKEKEESSNSTQSKNSLMLKLDPKTLSPIVSTVNSPIVPAPAYSPARNYQSPPFCRSTGSPISPRNSPVNVLSTSPFIPSPTPNTNPRLIYSHFPPAFPDANRFPNPLIRSPIGIPPPSAFHSSLPPSINKLYQRSSYIPQTTSCFSPVSQPPTVQRIPPSTSYSSPKSPKTTVPSGNFPHNQETGQPNFEMIVDGGNRDQHSVFNLSKTGKFGKDDKVKPETVGRNKEDGLPSNKSEKENEKAEKGVGAAEVNDESSRKLEKRKDKEGEKKDEASPRVSGGNLEEKKEEREASNTEKIEKKEEKDSESEKSGKEVQTIEQSEKKVET